MKAVDGVNNRLTSKHNNIVIHREIEKGRFKRTIEELSQFDNKKPEELESEFDHFDLDNRPIPSCINLT